ncbi:MAG: DUF2007 domain-containing protein [Candidatus Omnitrophica bacterium]|nr:DUF2007 domain-containing protein [Candidatus Omnitrophota bacterium]
MNEPEKSGFVTVLKTGNNALIAMAKSLLESAGIEYTVKGEYSQDFFAFGRLGTGFSPIVGPVEIQVLREDEEDTRGLLASLEENPS